MAYISPTNSRVKHRTLKNVLTFFSALSTRPSCWCNCCCCSPGSKKSASLYLTCILLTFSHIWHYFFWQSHLSIFAHSGSTSCIMGRREDKRRREKINKIVTKFSWETSYIARQWSVSRIEKTNMKFFQRSETFSETLILSMKLCFEEGKAKKSWLFCFESTQACVLQA